MKVEIDIEEILSPEEIKEIAKDVVSNQLNRLYSGAEENLQRLVVNLSYGFVFEMVNKEFDGNLENILKDKITEIINDLSAYSVFKKKDAWEVKDSAARIILDEEFTKARPLLQSRIEKIINEYEFDMLKEEEISDVVYECVMGKLFPERRDK